MGKGASLIGRKFSCFQLLGMQIGKYLPLGQERRILVWLVQVIWGQKNLSRAGFSIFNLIFKTFHPMQKSRLGKDFIKCQQTQYFSVYKLSPFHVQIMHILQFIQLLTFYNLSITSSLKYSFIARYGNCPQTIAILLHAVTWSNSVFVLNGFSGSQCRKTNR